MSRPFFGKPTSSNLDIITQDFLPVNSVSEVCSPLTTPSTCQECSGDVQCCYYNDFPNCGPCGLDGGPGTLQITGQCSEYLFNTEGSYPNKCCQAYFDEFSENPTGLCGSAFVPCAYDELWEGCVEKWYTGHCVNGECVVSLDHEIPCDCENPLP